MSIDSVPVGSLVQSPCNGERPIPLCSKVAAWDPSPIQRCLGCLEPRAFFCRFEIGAIQQRDQHPNRQGSGAEAKLEGQKIGPKIAIKQCPSKHRDLSAQCVSTPKSRDGSHRGGCRKVEAFRTAEQHLPAKKWPRLVPRQGIARARDLAPRLPSGLGIRAVQRLPHHQPRFSQENGASPASRFPLVPHKWEGFTAARWRGHVDHRDGRSPVTWLPLAHIYTALALKVAQYLSVISTLHDAHLRQHARGPRRQPHRLQEPRDDM